MSEELFKILSDYIIPKPEFCGKVFTWKLGKYFMICLPVEILNIEYH